MIMKKEDIVNYNEKWNEETSNGNRNTMFYSDGGL